MTSVQRRQRAAQLHRAPALPPQFVERWRLDHRFAEAGGRVVRVLAPGGYGKTSLVARWMANEPRPVRWVDLRREDDDPVALFQTLRTALAGLVDVEPPSAAFARADDPYAEALERALTAGGRPSSHVLVIDDVHRLASARANWLLTTLVEHLQPGSTVVIVGRGHHDHGAVGRTRLIPGVVDLTVDDLAFTDSESLLLLDKMGVDTHRPGVVEALRQLEGWPAGVRLAGQVLRSGGDVEHVAEHVSLVDYLRCEWTSSLEHDDLRFLSEVACLDLITVEACGAVLEHHGCGSRLRRLHRDEVVVLALDERDEVFRMHALLRRWLSNDLRAADPDRWTIIHRNAVRYYEQLGDVDRAVEHARLVGDVRTMAAIVTTHGGRYFTRGLDATVERWLAAFPADYVRRSAALGSLQCIKALHRGDDDVALRWLGVLDQIRADDCAGDATAVDDAHRWREILHAALDERPAVDLLPVIVAAREHVDNGAWADFASWVHGALAFMAGDLDTARTVLGNGAFAASLVGNHLVVSHCEGTLSIIDDLVGDPESAAAHAARAAEAVRTCAGELLPPSAVTMAALALRAACDEDPDTAARNVAAARRGLRGFRSTAPWFNVIARLALVRTALLFDDRPTASALADELEHHLRFEPQHECDDCGGAPAFARALRSQINAMHRPATGASSLTAAELRVLHLLPTNLSLPDMAARLYVSPNTVKTQVASIYRKLGVSRRAEAVERAVDAGLLQTISIA